jgi:hypothetical protein
MIHAAKHLLGGQHLATFGLEACEGHGAGALMQKNTIDVNQVSAI